MFETVLVANRGEIAVRILRTLRRMAIRSVAVYSDEDAHARHVREADSAVRLGPAPATTSYLSVEQLLRAAAATGSEAIHPGYGFLAENAGFAEACREAGLVFIGPPSDAIATMGDKIRAKRTVVEAGVPVVPGRTDSGMTDEDLAAAADEVGYPVLVKPSAGGGGKGMRLVHERELLPRELAGARREARASFGDDTLFVERFVLRPRHIEVQVLADTFGSVISLGERECSLQRRHQKIIEETPSVLLTEEQRSAMADAAKEIARAVRYEGVGTVEFIVSADAPGDFYFMEMNTRLQVEHPVTELVTGLDLVEQQIRVAAGEPLTLTQQDVQAHGHAMEARIYAENPASGFVPSGGDVRFLREAEGDGVRVDSSLYPGCRVGTTYDPMMSKIAAWGPDRTTALAAPRPGPGRDRGPRLRDQHQLPPRASRPPGRPFREHRHGARRAGTPGAGGRAARHPGQHRRGAATVDSAFVQGDRRRPLGPVRRLATRRCSRAHFVELHRCRGGVIPGAGLENDRRYLRGGERRAPIAGSCRGASPGAPPHRRGNDDARGRREWGRSDLGLAGRRKLCAPGVVAPATCRWRGQRRERSTQPHARYRAGGAREGRR